MIAHLLAIAVAGGSLSFYLALLLVPRIYRHPADFAWSGLGLFYALVLWVCAGRLTGGVLLGQTASVALLVWLGWQTTLLRQATDAVAPELPQALLKSPLGPLIQRFRPVTSAAEETSAPTSPSTPEASSPKPAIATPEETKPAPTSAADVAHASDAPATTEGLDVATPSPTVEAAPEPTPPLAQSSERTFFPAPTPTAVLPAVPFQDLSAVPEPAVIRGLQELSDLAALEPKPPTTPAPESGVALGDLDDELWGSGPKAAPPEPKPPVAQAPDASNPTGHSPISNTATPPQATAPNTTEAEVSTSFADRIVAATFNPEEEDIVDVDVISSSPPQNKVK